MNGVSVEFGKVDVLGLNQIDLNLPADDPRTWLALKKARDGRGAQFTPRIGVGAPVWGVKAWCGKVYPVGTQARDFLFHYSRQFNSIELNTTHYHIPDEATVTRWRETTPNGFKFNVKFLQDVSHRRPLAANAALTREFVARIMGLEDRLGLSFIQLPPAFSPSELPELKNFIAQLPVDFPLAVEVRHPDFFVDHRLSPRLFDLLSETEKFVVITDVAGRRDVLHTSLPGARVMVRFIGNDLHPTDDTRIVDWAQRLHTWLNLGLEQVEFFVHEPEDRATPEVIARFVDKMNQECGVALSKWVPYETETQLSLLNL
ncbi:MAG: DUF72 domain-containing protein [Bdellovibrionota bacterium]